MYLDARMPSRLLILVFSPITLIPRPQLDATGFKINKVYGSRSLSAQNASQSSDSR